MLGFCLVGTAVCVFMFCFKLLLALCLLCCDLFGFFCISIFDCMLFYVITLGCFSLRLRFLLVYIDLLCVWIAMV